MKLQWTLTEHEVNAFCRLFDVLGDSTDVAAYLESKDFNTYRRLRYVLNELGYQVACRKESEQ